MNIIDTNLKFKQMDTRKSTQRIILHHAAAKTCSAEDIHRWHLNNGWSGCGYHFLVRKDGSIYRGRPENKLGAHTQNYNTGSIGICFEGSYNSEQMPEAQLRSGQELVTYLCDKYNLLKANVYKHKDFNSTDCPGTNFPFELLQKGTNNSNTDNKINIIDELKAECTRQGFSDYPMCRKGAKGNITKIIQRLLIEKGYKLSKYGADGSFGAETEKAIKKFQSDNGLSIDGIVGKNTWSKLLND